jgi:hypothetical protein
VATRGGGGATQSHSLKVRVFTSELTVTEREFFHIFTRVPFINHFGKNVFSQRFIRIFGEGPFFETFQL